MSAKSRGTPTLHFADGASITAFESVALRHDYLDPLGSFSFQVSPPAAKRADYRERLAKGERVTLAIDGAQQAVGIITTVEHTIGDDGYTLAVEAKSPLCTADQSSVDPYVAKRFTSDTPIVDLILEVLSPFGFTEVSGDPSADVAAISGKPLNGRKPKIDVKALTHKEAEAQPNETHYGFVARLTTRVGVVLRVDHDGKLLVGSPDYDQDAAYTVVQDRTLAFSGDRMLRSPAITVRDTNDNQFSEVICVGRSSDFEGTTSASTPIAGVCNDITNRPSSVPFPKAKLRATQTGRHTYKSTAHPWKPKYRIDKKTTDIVKCQNVAELIHGTRAAQAFTIQHSVDGLISVSGQRVWAVDTVGRVIIDELGINEDMWLMSVTQNVSHGGGQRTDLTWIPLGSLVLGEPPE